MPTINNSDIVSAPAWGKVDKAKLKKDLIASKSKAAINEAFAVVRGYELSKDLKLPHHVLSGGVLKPHQGGIYAAAVRFKSTDFASSEERKKAGRHLTKHYKTMDKEPPQVLKNTCLEEGLEYEEVILALLELVSEFSEDPPEDEDDDDEEDDEADDTETGDEEGPEDEDEEDADDEDSDEDDDAEEESKETTKETKEEKSENATYSANSISTGKRVNTVLLENKLHLPYDEGLDAFHMRFDCRIGSASAVIDSVDDTEIKQLWQETVIAKAKMPPDKMPPDDDDEDMWAPNAEELQKIRAMAGVPVKKESVKRYFAFVADRGPFLNGDHMSGKAHEQMAAMDKGSPWIKNHNLWNVESVVGRIFDSGVMRGSKGIRNWQKYYALNAPELQYFLQQIENGINANLSVHFMVMRADYICDTCKKPMFSRDWRDDCGHMPGQQLPDGSQNTQTVENMSRYFETSSVVKGNVQTATFKHSAVEAVSEMNAHRSNYSVRVLRDLIGVRDFHHDHTTIQQAHQIGDSTVPNEDPTKPAAQNPPAAETDPAAQAPDGAAPASSANADQGGEGFMNASELQNLVVEAINSIVKPSTEQLQAVMKELSAGIEKIASLNEETSKAASERIKGLEASYKEQEQRLTTLYEAFMASDKMIKEFLDSVNTLKALSVDDVARAVANSRAVPNMHSRVEEEAQKSHQVYTDVQSQLLGRKPVGNEQK